MSGIIRLLALVAVLWSGTANAQESPGPNSRADATRIVAEMRRIVTPEGVERLEAVQLGGIEQWISIRGMDRRNPILLMLHGGPGYTAMPTSWYFQRGWEEFFTVVQWDQRGAGKTYTANDPEAVAPTMTLERMVADAEELIDWLRREFGQERIFLMGHSWGSVLGLTLAQRHPERLHAYVGVGQVIDMRESERRGWRFAMERARQEGNREAIRELESIAPYAQAGAPIPLEHLYRQRRWLNHYGGAVHGRTGFAAEIAAIRMSPEYDDEDIRSFLAGNESSPGRLLGEIVEVDLAGLSKLDVPLLLFNGRHDHNVSATVAAEWYERVQAPSKRMVWFESSAHQIMNEEPGKTLVSLVQYALPLAEAADQARPDTEASREADRL